MVPAGALPTNLSELLLAAPVLLLPSMLRIRMEEEQY
jgi:hypothetical protein